MASSNPPRSVAQPVVARGEGQVDQRGRSVHPVDVLDGTRKQVPDLGDLSSWNTRPYGCFGQDQMSRKSLKMLALCRRWQGHRAVSLGL